MKVNRNSWHYKLYNASFGQGSWPPERTNLCKYFWRVVGMSIVSVCIILTAIMCIASVILLTFLHPLFAAALITGCGVVYGGIRGYRWALNKTAGQEPGLVRSYLKAKKDKVCPFIEFEY